RIADYLDGLAPAEPEPAEAPPLADLQIVVNKTPLPQNATALLSPPYEGGAGGVRTDRKSKVLAGPGAATPPGPPFGRGGGKREPTPHSSPPYEGGAGGGSYRPKVQDSGRSRRHNPPGPPFVRGGGKRRFFTLADKPAAAQAP